MPETGSRSGFDSSSDRTMGELREEAGRLVDDERMQEEGMLEREVAHAEEEEALEPTRRQSAAEDAAARPDA